MDIIPYRLLAQLVVEIFSGSEFLPQGSTMNLLDSGVFAQQRLAESRTRNTVYDNPLVSALAGS